MKHKPWNYETHDCIGISFFPDCEANGGALRETMVLLVKRGKNAINASVLTKAETQARKLKAKSYRIWKLIPRVFGLPEDD